MKRGRNIEPAHQRGIGEHGIGLAKGFDPLGTLVDLLDRALHLRFEDDLVERARAGEFRAHLGQRLVGDPPAFGDSGDPAFRLHHRQQPARTGDRPLAEAEQFGQADRPVPDRGEDHSRQPHVGGKDMAAVDLGRQVEAREQRRRIAHARQRLFESGHRAQGRRIGRIELGRIVDQLAKRQAVSGMDYEAFGDLAFFRLHTPSLCRGMGQHVARCRRRFAKGSFIRREAGPCRRGGEIAAAGKCPDRAIFRIVART